MYSILYSNIYIYIHIRLLFIMHSTLQKIEKSKN